MSSGRRKVKGEGMGREGRRERAAELRGERQNLVVSPGGGDALQAPECTQTLSHRGAAQPERARHRALCERERGREEENEVERVRERRKGRARDQIWEVKEQRRGLMREVGRRKPKQMSEWMDEWTDGWKW